MLQILWDGPYAPNFLGTEIEHVQTDVRQVAHLLHCDARLSAQEGNADRAWSACLGMVHVAETIGDEPILVTQLVRMAVNTMAVTAMERALAQRHATAQTLVEARQVFHRLSGENLFLIGIRGERGGFHMLMTNLLNGSAQLAELAQSRQKASLWDRVSQRLAGNKIREAHIYLLRHLTRMIAAAQLSGVEAYQTLADLEVEFKSGAVTGEVPVMAKLLLPAVRRVAEADRRCRTHFACACVALAAEQYRMNNGRWPDSPNDLVAADLLKEVPLDLFDGKPLRWRRTDDGLVVFSIGPKGDYQGDALDDNSAPSSDVRVEFRLWNPDRRRQTPASN